MCFKECCLFVGECLVIRGRMWVLEFLELILIFITASLILFHLCYLKLGAQRQACGIWLSNRFLSPELSQLWPIFAINVRHQERLSVAELKFYLFFFFFIYSGQWEKGGMLTNWHWFSTRLSRQSSSFVWSEYNRLDGCDVCLWQAKNLCGRAGVCALLWVGRRWAVYGYGVQGWWGCSRGSRKNTCVSPGTRCSAPV